MSSRHRTILSITMLLVVAIAVGTAHAGNMVSFPTQKYTTWKIAGATGQEADLVEIGDSSRVSLSAMTTGAPAWMRVGNIWHRVDPTMEQGWSSSWSWPGGRTVPPYREYLNERYGSVSRKQGLMVATKDWVPPSASDAERLTSFVDSRTLVPQSHMVQHAFRGSGAWGGVGALDAVQIQRALPSQVIVNGMVLYDQTDTFGSAAGSPPAGDGETNYGARRGVIDPNLPSHRAIYNLFRFQMGVDIRQTVHAYAINGGVDSDYLLYDFVIRNTGVMSRRPGSFVKGHERALDDFWFSYNWHAGPSTGDIVLGNYADDVLEWFEPWPSYTTGGVGHQMVMFYDGDKSGWPEDWGGPNYSSNINPAYNMGYDLWAKQYTAVGWLFAETAPGSGADDPSQPQGTNWCRERDYNLVMFGNNMQAQYRTIFCGGQTDDVPRRVANGVAASVGFADPTPYIGLHWPTFPHNSEVHAVMVVAAGGINDRMARSMGRSMVMRRDASESVVQTPPEIDLIKTGRDSVKRALDRAFWNVYGYDPNGSRWANKPAAFNHAFNVPDPPAPPAAAWIESGDGRNIVEWMSLSYEGMKDPDTGVNDFAGYRVYRAVGSPDSDYVLVYQGTAARFEDTSVSRDFPYYYFVTAYDDGSQNWSNPGVMLESSRFALWNGVRDMAVRPSMSEEHIDLPTVPAIIGEPVEFPILATTPYAYSVRLTIAFDTSLVSLDPDPIARHAFEGSGATPTWSLTGNKLYIGFDSQSPVTLSNDMLVVLRFHTKINARPGINSPVTCLSYPNTTINGLPVIITNGSFFVNYLTGTAASGHVSGIWTKANSPYRVVASISVPAGDSLVIESGVDVMFEADVPFVVNGTLRVMGAEADSVRFVLGHATEWGGIRFIGANSSVLNYARISGGRAHGYESPYDQGGGVYVAGSETHVRMSHSVISHCKAEYNGGGIMVDDTASVSMEWCTIAADSSYFAGGVYTRSNTVLNMSHCTIEDNDGGGAHFGGKTTARDCVFRRNTGEYIGGVEIEGQTDFVGCLVHANRITYYGGGGVRCQSSSSSVGSATLVNCTISDNSAPENGGGISAGSSLIALNCVVSGNTPDNVRSVSDIVVNYSNIGFPLGVIMPGIGNMNADPLFADPVAGDYSLLAASPCIDAGSPNSPRDPDGSRADMGAIAFDHGGLPLSLALPTVKCPPGRTALVTVNATLHEASSVELVFTVDSTVMAPDAEFLRSHAFADGLVTWRVSGDTVRVAMASASPVFLNDSPLVTLAFRVANDALPDTLPIAWDSRTRIDERAAALADGELIVYVATGTYGDVNGNGTISALDASLILRYVVQLIPEIMVAVADVTANGTVSAYDAALVLRRVVDPEFRFPVEGDLLAKSSVTSPRTLVWVREGSAWVLTIDGPTDILGAEFVLGLPDGAVPVVTGDSERTAFRQEGTALRIALVLTGGSSPTLFRIECPELANPPFIRSMDLNEGAVIVDRIVRPVEFSLSQNAPNPFNPETVIRYGLPATGHVELTIYDATGRLVRVLVSGEMIAGAHEVVWNGVDGAGRSVASGVYVYRLSSAYGTIVRRMTLVR